MVWVTWREVLRLLSVEVDQKSKYDHKHNHSQPHSENQSSNNKSRNYIFGLILDIQNKPFLKITDIGS